MDNSLLAKILNSRDIKIANIRENVVLRKIFDLTVRKNIGIKHGFLCINICLAPREALKAEPERRGFQPSRWGPVDVNASERKC